MRAWTAAMRIGVIVCVAAGALSCAPITTTSRPAPIVDRTASPRPAPPPVATLPTPPAPQPAEPSVSTFPLMPPPDLQAQAPSVQEQPPPAADATPAPRQRPTPSTDSVALILPLEAPAYARAAEAVRAGFVAAANVVGAGGRVIVIGHKEDGVLEAFEKARARGVRVVVGPLLRDDLKTLAIAEPEIPWTIALNQLEEKTSLPPEIFSFALTIEADAHLLARRAQYDGVRTVDIISGDAPLMKRFASAFATDWTAAGGRLPGDFRFDPAPENLALLRRNLSRAAPDAVLLAVDGTQAALVKSFVGPTRAYASGLLFDRPDPAIVRDLNDVTIVDLPWIVTPDAPQFAAYPRGDFGNAPLDRLYALGLDAFRISQAFAPNPPPRFTLEGATGHIELNDARQFAREGQLAVYRDARLMPIDAPR